MVAAGLREVPESRGSRFAALEVQRRADRGLSADDYDAMPSIGIGNHVQKCRPASARLTSARLTIGVD
ncbi:hypothetical protein SAMN05421805_101673 [Saccharopolyspora antimicrobica]|uniref:Uncharacterized protein n=1 Tax=Saccharopolyspora antimicrobica TaxID=455193 RepID=A0A1I4RS96_9PSEU|nr:hypothetical protein ATL45_6318 [Saccharopolyspora antimicrobica]SFM55142.1 hypothetical protein SAMN05421805_101673 [Saccharopolyspora antimicrobica]